MDKKAVSHDALEAPPPSIVAESIQGSSYLGHLIQLDSPLPPPLNS